MHIVVFGLTISSSWGNGHATLWRSLLKALLARNHTLTFFEKDLPYYAHARDLTQLPQGATLILYNQLEDILPRVKTELAQADLALFTSFCPDGRRAATLILDSPARIKAFYDLDTPVTLEALASAGELPWLPPEGLAGFDLVLSYTGGRALTELRTRLGARLTAPLYGSVDPENHHPAPPDPNLRANLSYLGTYAPDRQPALAELFLTPARRLPGERFLLGGAQYPQDFAWQPNLHHLPHVPPALHPAFFSSSRATLNITRAAMARYGFCPSGRLFEAAACGVPLLSDTWPGLDTFFTPGLELIQVRTSEDVLDSLSLSDPELRRIAEAARARTLTEHTGHSRILTLETLCNTLLTPQPELAAHS